LSADVETTEDGSLQIMYGIDGYRELTESTRDDLSGYAGARPVRVGNAAFSQRQNDVFGAVLDSILLHTRRNQRLPRRLWPIVEAQAACATRVWRDPDQGIWECRGKPQHYVSSKLMCWVALDRASRLAEIRGDPNMAATWRATADEIQADVLAHGVSDRGVLRQHYETDALDASTLLAGSFKFLAHDDKRLRNTVLAVAEELTENGFVLRYRTDETNDGFSGKEGTFVICSFWLVSALAIVGEMQRARDLMERLLRIASPLGLYAEEYDPATGRHLGNFPQAFSHLALIEAAARMIFECVRRWSSSGRRGSDPGRSDQARAHARRSRAHGASLVGARNRRLPLSCFQPWMFHESLVKQDDDLLATVGRAEADRLSEGKRAKARAIKFSRADTGEPERPPNDQCGNDGQGQRDDAAGREDH
jgi:alpha,alpha-trehalase